MRDCVEGVCKSPLRNNLGVVFVFESKGVYYMGLKDYGPLKTVVVTEDFYKAFKKEFSKETT